jgi:hypothetical protein
LIIRKIALRGSRTGDFVFRAFPLLGRTIVAARGVSGPAKGILGEDCIAQTSDPLPNQTLYVHKCIAMSRQVTEAAALTVHVVVFQGKIKSFSG